MVRLAIMRAEQMSRAPGFPWHVEFHAHTRHRICGLPQNSSHATEIRGNGHYSRFVNILVKFLVANSIFSTK